MRLLSFSMKSCSPSVSCGFARVSLSAAIFIWAAAEASASPDARVDRETLNSNASNNCGAVALHQLAVALKGTNADTAIIDGAPVPANGFSMTELLALSSSAGLDLVAVQLLADGPIPVPSLVHWKRGHYSAIVDQRKGVYEVLDSDHHTRWLSGKMIIAESSGDFMVQPDKTTTSYRGLAQPQTDLIFGGAGMGPSDYYPDTNDIPPWPVRCSGCAYGMATWAVSEPSISLWLTDEPLGYVPALGNRISFELNYDQRGTLVGTNPAVFSCGSNWNCSWISYVVAPSATPGPAPLMTLFLACGGERGYTANGTTPEYYSRSVMSVTTNVGGTLTGCTVAYPNGASESYNEVFTDPTGDVLCFRTTLNDPAGHITKFLYTNSSTNITLVGVVDTDGRTNTLSYTNTSLRNQITGVTDPFGRSATLKYNSTGLLTNITDVMNLSSAFTYGASNWITSLTTPYGTTTFTLTDNQMATNNAIDRAVMVVDPLGGTNLYLSRYQASFLVGSNYTVPNTPSGSPSFSSTAMTNLNTWHWGPMQSQHWSTANMYSFSPEDYFKGRQRNWLAGSGSSSIIFSDALNMEQGASPNGTTTGLQTWHSYDGEAAGVQGTNALPAVVAWNLPDTNSYYQWIQRNVWGNPTIEQETWSQNFGGTTLTRSNLYYYYTNGIDLQQQIGPLNETVGGFSYDTHHNVLTATNAVGYVTTYTYDGQFRPTSVTSPAGLTTTNVYFSSGAYTNWVQQRIDLQIHRTNTYFYSNDLVMVQTNELGLVVTNTWDNLQRLTSTTFPDTTDISNIYVNLDQVENIDRLGNKTTYGYDALRHLVAATNALTNVTRYSYCDCGALESVQNALGFLTSYSYDIAGHLVNTAYPDTTSISNNYDPLSRITNTIDGAGRSVTNVYTDQGLLYASSNAVGQVFLKSFDIEDRMTNSVDRNGVVTTNSYDLLKRVLTCGYPDGGVERFGYSAFGLIAYTNQLTNSTYYAYDAALRKTAETNALLNVTQYAYDAASDLTSLTDQNNHTTQWGYDLYGRMTNKVDATGESILQYKYDADSRLTNRWSLAMSNTAYAYDAVGNLTGVTYHTSHALSFSHDAVNQLISMSDGIGTTTFTYTQTGQLASESGPWASDAVSYSYNDHLRSALNLEQPNASAWVQNYNYDMAARLTGITSPAGTFSYTFNPGLAGKTTASTLIGEIALPNGAWITNTYDNNGRMLGTWLTNSTSNIDSSVYTYNVGNQRTTVTRIGENMATYTYDKIGQVVGDVAVEGTTNRMNEQLYYAFDPAGNLIYRTNNTLIANFQVNTVNELTANTNGGRLTVMGTTTSSATNVTVNGTNALRYGDATFAATNMLLTTTYTATASDNLGRHSTNTVTVSIATNTTYQYDGNGNLTNDGLRSFAYDNENQLIQVWVANQWFSQFAYDAKMRRRIRQEYTWQSGAWVQTNEVYYVYDGNVVIQERNINNLPATTYTRGNDLSSSLEGSGGIGGLLSMTLNFESETLNSNSFFYHADGNGNVTMLINPSQYIVAKYLYDAFGNVLSAAGSLAQANLYRFSSKEAHLNSGLVYYLYRYYDPNLQRWLNRDPILENGAINLYSYVNNSPISGVDPFGEGPPPVPPWESLYHPFAPIPSPFPTTPSNPYSPYLPSSNPGSAPPSAISQFPSPGLQSGPSTSLNPLNPSGLQLSPPPSLSASATNWPGTYTTVTISGPSLFNNSSQFNNDWTNILQKPNQSLLNRYQNGLPLFSNMYLSFTNIDSGKYGKPSSLVPLINYNF
jgi:RHS repeat-associated protein